MTKISCCANKRRKKSFKKIKTKQEVFFRGRKIHVLWKSKKNTSGSNSSIFLEGGPSESSFPLSAAPGEKTIRGSKRFLTRAAVWLDDEDSGCSVYDYTYTYPTYLHIYMCIRKNIWSLIIFSFITWEFQDQWMILVGLPVGGRSPRFRSGTCLPLQGFLGNISHPRWRPDVFFSKKQISIDDKNLPDVHFFKKPISEDEKWDGIKIHKNPYPNGSALEMADSLSTSHLCWTKKSAKNAPSSTVMSSKSRVPLPQLWLDSSFHQQKM